MGKYKLIEDFIQSNLTNHENYNHDLWFIFCINNNISLEKFCNDFALFIAKGFQSYQFDYELCDEILNSLFVFMSDYLLMDHESLDDFPYKLETLPEPAFSIFQAFDEGEYFRKNDLPHVSPPEKYVRPQVIEILSKYYKLFNLKNEKITKCLLKIK